MSGLLDSIVRRRRASAGSRLGPPGTDTPYRNGAAPSDNGVAHVNGASPPAVIYHALQLAHGLPEAPRAEPLPEAPAHPVDPDGTQEFDAVSAEVAEVQAVVESPARPEDEDRVVLEMPADVVEPAAPAEVEPEVPPEHEEPDEPAFRERGRLRRRIKYLRQLREIHLRDIGGFMVELHRFGRQRPDLVQAKIEGAAKIDAELRVLERALASQQTIRELREAGIGGACENCGAVHGSTDRYCASCGEALDGRAAAPAEPEE
jgi:hypothetical protein